MRDVLEVGLDVLVVVLDEVLQLDLALSVIELALDGVVHLPSFFFVERRDVVVSKLVERVYIAANLLCVLASVHLNLFLPLEVI